MVKQSSQQSDAHVALRCKKLTNHPWKTKLKNLLSQGTFCHDWHIHFPAKRLNMHFWICLLATDLTSHCTLGTGCMHADCMESGRREQHSSLKSLIDLNRFCHVFVVVICAMFGLGGLTAIFKDFVNWALLEDINSIEATGGWSTMIGKEVI